MAHSSVNIKADRFALSFIFTFAIILQTLNPIKSQAQQYLTAQTQSAQQSTPQITQSLQSLKVPVLTTELGIPNSGEFQFDIGLRTPSTKFPFPFRIHYNSESVGQNLGKGWSLALPFVVRTASTLSFHNGIFQEKLYAEGTSGWYHTRHNQRFYELPGQSFVQYFPDGSFHTYAQLSPTPQNSKWLLSSVENRYGLKSELLYSSEFGGNLPYRITVDQFTGSANAFSVEFQANGAGNLIDDISILSSQGALLHRYHQSYSSSPSNQPLLNSVSEYDRLNSLIGTHSFSYFGSGKFVSKLSDITIPTSGRYSIEYGLSSVNDINSGRISSRAHVKTISSDNALGQILTSSYLFSGGVSKAGTFVGFREVAVTAADGSAEINTFKIEVSAGSILPTNGLLTQSQVKDTTGALFSQTWQHYITGGINNKLIVRDGTVSAEYGAAGIQQRLSAEHITFDFNAYRPTQLFRDGEITSYDPINNTVVDLIQNDNTRAVITYFTDVPGTNVLNLSDSIVEFAGHNTKISEVKFVYNGSAELTTMRRWDNSQSANSYVDYTFLFDNHGNLSHSGSPDGISTSATYEGFRIKTLTIDPSSYNFVTSFDYDTDTLELKTITPPSGIQTIIDYDDAIRIKSVKSISGLSSQNLQDINYNIGGISGSISNNSVITLSRGIETRLYFDGFGQIIQDKSFPAPEYLTTDYTYGTQGLSRASSTYLNANPANTVSVTGIQSYTNNFDDSLRISSVTPSIIGNGSGVYTLSSDLLGDPHGMLSTDALNKTAYQTQNGASTVVSKGSSSNSVTLELFGDIPASTARIMDVSGNSFSSTFDSLGRALSISPAVSAALQITYKPNGWLNTVQDTLNNTARYQFDALGRMTHTSAAGADREAYFIDYYYDAPSRIGFNVPKGFVSLIRGPFDSIEFDYTALGELREIIQTVNATGQEYVTQFSYNSRSLVQDVTYPNGLTISTDYDERNLEKRVYSSQLIGLYSGGVISQITSRSKDGNITNRSWGNGVIENITHYQSSGEMQNYTSTSGGQLIYALHSDYDNQNLIQTTEQIPSQSKITSYAYDEMNRLSGLTINGIPYTLTRDTLGRVVNNSQENPTMNYLYNNTAIPYLPSEIAGSSSSNLFQYNSNKETVSSFGRVFQYNAIGDVVRVASSNGSAVAFERSVLGNHLRTFDYGTNGTTITTKIGAGLYELIQDPGNSTPHGRVYVIGEQTGGSIGTISIIDFAASPPPPGQSSFKDDDDTEPATPTPTEPPQDDPICGNGKLEEGEECDDNNVANDDGCSASCKWETSTPGTLPTSFPKPTPTPPSNPPPVSGTTTQTGPNGEQTTDSSGQSTNTSIADKKLQSENTDVSNHEYASVGLKETGPCDETRDTIVHIKSEVDLPTSLDDNSATYNMMITGTLSSGQTVLLGYDFFHGGNRSTMVYFNDATGEIIGSSTSNGSGKTTPFPDPSDFSRLPSWYLQWLSQNSQATDYYEIMEHIAQKNWYRENPSRRYGALPLVTDQYISVPGILSLSVGLPTATAATVLVPGPEDLALMLAARTVSIGIATGTKVCAVTKTLIREWRLRKVARSFDGRDLCLGLEGEFNGTFASYAHTIRGLSRFEKAKYPKSWMDRTHLQFRKEAYRTIQEGGILRFNLNRMDLSFPQKWEKALTTRELRYILKTPELENRTIFYLNNKPYSSFEDAHAAWSLSK